MAIKQQVERTSRNARLGAVETEGGGLRNVGLFLRYLHEAVGVKVFVWLAIVVCAAVLDGLAVGLFLPILEGEDSDSAFSRFMVGAFDAFGLRYSLGAALIAMVAFFAVRSAFMVFQEMYVARIITRLLVQLKRGLITKLFEADYRYFVRKESSYFINAATIEYNSVASAFEKSVNLVVAAGFAAVYFALPMLINPVLTLAVLALGIPALLLLRRVNRLTTEYSMTSTSINARLQSYLIQALRSYKYLKATHSSRRILGRTVETAEQQGEIRYKQSVLSALVSNGTELFMMLLVAGLLFYYVEIEGVQLIEVVFLLFLVRRAVGFALRVYSEYRKFLGASGSIRVFLDLERELEEEREKMAPGGAVPDFGQPLRFEAVSFSYGDSAYVLKNIDLVIPPKRTVAIVGASGAGKSTLVTLLTGILRPTEGKIYLGGLDYQAFDQAKLRQGLGYVTQESVIFNDTIRNNLTLWQMDVPEEAVRGVAARAYIQQFIEGLPDSYDTLLGDDGVNVSGGQRQRISIARELFKDAQVLIFDEATSSLDSKSEREIQLNIDDLHGEKTIVVIAHRLSTVRNSDEIYVLKDGSIIEKGSYAELIVLGGEFKSMVDQQALTDDPSPD
ncbi:MAG: ABC transporter ATP-binding protein [Chloroflexi bacterium]|nr:ABC transporter ATP-binding protein [Chloroflexota bacterium]